ncbi:MAG: transposase, partial [Candidatus Midichloria mitochondrii]|nr:transposase [Candidatus Midichloria mitochondrii]
LSVGKRRPGWFFGLNDQGEIMSFTLTSVIQMIEPLSKKLTQYLTGLLFGDRGNPVVAIPDMITSINQDNNFFDEIARWFIALCQQLGYSKNSDESKNLEYTLLQGLYEVVLYSAAGPVFSGLPRCHPEFLSWMMILVMRAVTCMTITRQIS